MDEKTAENTEKDKGLEPKKGPTFKQSVFEFIKFFIIAALIVVPIRMWVAQPFIVSGSSMVPNFHNGEYLVIDEFSYHFREPQRGEVIIFRYPNDLSKFFIKRIIGLPNERLEINNNEIRVFNEEFPDGVFLNENFLQNENIHMANMNVSLNSDQYFVMGDNRNMSSDSRNWGPLGENLIIGRAWLRLWPFNEISIFP